MAAQQASSVLNSLYIVRMISNTTWKTHSTIYTGDSF